MLHRRPGEGAFTLKGRLRAFLVAAGLGTSLSSAGCASRATHANAASRAAQVADPAAPTLESLLTRRPDLVLTVHPPALSRDAVYGPLLRRASELATAYAGPTNLGTTALAVLERTEEVVVAENDRGKEAVVVLRGVPASVDPLEIVDTAGHAVWRPIHGDVRTQSRELEPVEAADVALFIAPGLVWVIASGPAVARARAALLGGAGLGKASLAGDETPLISLSLPGNALPQLRQGALAPVGAGLQRIQIDLTPGREGVIVSKLTYPDANAAASAEETVTAVTLAFRHRLEESVRANDDQRSKERAKSPRTLGSLDWLGAAKVDRMDAVIVVRAPIPRPWLNALAKADVAVPSL
jgi:hypothetical protein